MKGHLKKLASFFLLIPFMTKQAAVFGRMVFWQRHILRIMAFHTEFFSCLLFHIHKTVMILVMGELGRSLLRGVKEEEQYSN